MLESMRPGGADQAKLQEFSSGLTSFDVVDRTGERIGWVKNVNPARTCILVETRRSRRFARKQTHAVHVWAVREIDLDRLRIVLAASKQDVADAQLRELDEQSETAVARHYYDRLAALGEAVDTDAPEGP